MKNIEDNTTEETTHHKALYCQLLIPACYNDITRSTQPSCPVENEPIFSVAMPETRLHVCTHGK